MSDSRSRFFIVADGMGGQSAGEKASAIAVELIPQKLEQLIDFDAEEPQEVLRKVDLAVEYANAEIMALGEVESNCKNM
ncbi:MAG: protein phosphatase 2C domain-containing protein, partial [Planctomycetaceae bacterium]